MLNLVDGGVVHCIVPFVRQWRRRLGRGFRSKPQLRFSCQHQLGKSLRQSKEFGHRRSVSASGVKCSDHKVIAVTSAPSLRAVVRPVRECLQRAGTHRTSCPWTHWPLTHLRLQTIASDMFGALASLSDLLDSPLSRRVIPMKHAPRFRQFRRSKWHPPSR